MGSKYEESNCIIYTLNLKFSKYFISTSNMSKTLNFKPFIVEFFLISLKALMATSLHKVYFKL